MSSSPCARRATTAALVAAIAWLPGAGAAENHCGARYVVQPGDTLASIAGRCGTSVEALAETNAQITDPARISVGWELEIPGARASLGPESEVRPRARSEEAEEALAAGSYDVQPGDSFASIATALQVPLRALIEVNEGLDPFGLRPGQSIRLPDGATEGRRGGAADAPDGEAEAAGATEAEASDNSSEQVEAGDPEDWGPAGAPDRAGGGRDAVVGAGPEDPRAEEPEEMEAGGRLTLQGRVQNGTECAVLETPEGDLYSLVSAEYGLLPGEYVEIEGETVEMSLCMEAKATVRVTSITTLPAPQGG